MLGRGWRARRKTAEAVDADSLCLLPWLNLSVDVDGSSRPCCKFEHTDAVDGQPFRNLRDASLAEVWDSPGLVRLRDEFRRGLRPTGCANCWAEEAAGVRSFRQTYLADREIDPDVDVEDLHPAQPRGLDLKLSNTCNLACRICGPVASSRWLTEELQVTPAPRPPGSFVAFLADNRRFLADNKLTGRPDDRARLEAWAAGVQHLELTGGEPMLSKESAEVLELLVAHGDPARTTLQITTNATTINPRITDHLPRFKHVSISLSVDDLGPRLEYQRDPARWDEVRENIERYAALATEQCEVFLNATVSILNVWDLPTFLGWWDERYPAGTGIGFTINLVHHPVDHCVQQLPEEVKTEVLAHWERHPDAGRRRVRPLLEHVTGFVRAQTADPRQWDAFVAATRRLDERRGQRFEAVYPTFVAALAATGNWPGVGDG